MSLVVEDGTGLPSADAYASVDTVTTYHAAFGNDDWIQLDAATQEILVRRATRDIDAIYGSGYASTRLTTTQSLKFPRTTFTTSDGVTIFGIPSALVSAVAELALITSTIDPTGIVDQAGNEKMNFLRIGEFITHTEKFAPTSTSASALRKVSILLRPLLANNALSLNVPLVRG